MNAPFSTVRETLTVKPLIVVVYKHKLPNALAYLASIVPKKLQFDNVTLYSVVSATNAYTSVFEWFTPLLFKLIVTLLNSTLAIGE